MPYATERVFRGRIHNRIHRDMQTRLGELERDRSAIAGRLAELDREWDLDRAFFIGAGAIVLATGIGLALRSKRATPALPAGAFLLARGLFGWAPPFAILRLLRMRSRQEIEHERTALRALRGDFGQRLDSRRAFEVATRALPQPAERVARALGETALDAARAVRAELRDLAKLSPL